MNARMTVALDGADAPVIATAVEPDVASELPGANVERRGPETFVVEGNDPAAFRAACNTLLRLVATGAGVASDPDGPPARGN